MTNPLAALIAGVRPNIIKAIHDPGATEGYRGDRTLTEWQTDAVMRAVLAALEAAPVPDLVEAGKVEANLRNERTIATRTEAADTIRALVSLATAQAAQIADLTEGQARAEQEERIRTRQLADETIRAEAALAAERAKVAKLVEAGKFLAWMQKSGKSVADAKEAWAALDAAITEVGQ